jgi:hypothetical protein
VVHDPSVLAAAARVSRHGISAGPVVAFVAIVAAAAVILVVVVSYFFHHRSLSADTTQWTPQLGANQSFSSEPGNDKFSR